MPGLFDERAHYVGWRDIFKRRKHSDDDVAQTQVFAGPDARPLVAPLAGNPMPRFQDRANGLSLRSTRSPIRMRMRSAFTPSQPVSNVSMFAGRRGTLVSLIRAIEDQQTHIVLYGDRGIGKTSLLHVMASLAREAGYLVRYVSCSDSSTFSDTFKMVAGDIPLIYHTEIDPTSERAEAGGTLADLMPAGKATVAQVSEMLGKLTGTRLLIVLDEFDRSDAEEFRRAIAELIKNLSDRGSRVQLVIAGVAGNLTELIRHIPSIRRNIVGLAVPNMSDDEVRELIQIGSKASGLSYAEAAVRLVVRIANGSPYLASLLAQHAGIAGLDRGVSVVEQQDVMIALDRALSEVEQRVSPACLHNFAQITENATHAVLVEVAREALAKGGRIAPAPAKPEINADEYRRELMALDTRFQLLEPTPDAPGGGYQFREEGAALYFWLRSAHHNDVGGQARIAVTG